MIAKFILGLTDVEDSDIYLENVRLNDRTDINFEKTDCYALAENNKEIQKADITWLLNTDLPAVQKLLEVVDLIQSRLYYSGVIVNSTLPVLVDSPNITIYAEMLNLIPNYSLVLPAYTDEDYAAMNTNHAVFGALELDVGESCNIQGYEGKELMPYAFYHNDTSYLIDGPVDKVVTPAFRINFTLGDPTAVRVDHSSEQKEWFNNNKDVLLSKGYDINDVKNKLGALQIGTLTEDPTSAYEKIKNYRKVCSVEIVVEE